MPKNKNKWIKKKTNKKKQPINFPPLNTSIASAIGHPASPTFLYYDYFPDNDEDAIDEEDDTPEERRLIAYACSRVKSCLPSHYGPKWKKKHRKNSQPFIYFPTSERCERTSEWTKEWPSTSVCTLGYSGPQCIALAFFNRYNHHSRQKRISIVQNAMKCSNSSTASLPSFCFRWWSWWIWRRGNKRRFRATATASAPSPSAKTNSGSPPPTKARKAVRWR